MTCSFLALGGNIGDVEQTFSAALQRLNSQPGICVEKMSSIHRFPAVGKDAGAEFLNAAAQIETSLEPRALLDCIQDVEDHFDRKRETHWGPRPLDLDFILHGSEVIDTPGLQVPHPACWYRRFVLDPLIEIAADVMHPTKNTTIGTLRERLMQRPFCVGLAGKNRSVGFTRNDLFAIARDFPEVDFVDWNPADGDSADENSIEQACADEPTLLIWLGSDEQEPETTFESLPLIPRLDVSACGDALPEFLRNVLHSALAS